MRSEEERHTEVRCPKCSEIALTYPDGKKYCPACNYNFKYSSEGKEKKYRGKIKQRQAKRSVYLYVGAVLVSVLIVSLSVYYIWYDDATPDYIDIEEVSDIRGLKAISDIHLKQMSKDELREYLVDSLDEEMREEMRREEIIYENLFVIERDVDLFGASLNSSVENIAGFYDPEAKQMYVIGGHTTSYVNYILSHEYTHALQDQHFQLTEFLNTNLTYDQHLARLSVAEGDATIVMTEYLKTMSWEERLIMTLDATVTLGMSYQNLLDQEGNSALTNLALFPYIEGERYVRRFLGDGADGWENVDAIYREPPASSEQILHPDKYRKEEAPAEIEPEPPLEGFRLEFSDTLGEAFLVQMLDLHISQEVGNLTLGELPALTTSGEIAKEAAKGWGGDSYQYYVRADTALSVFHTTWDTAADNREFDAAHDTLLRKLSSYPLDGDIYPIRDGYLRKESSGNDTVIYYSLDKGVIEDLAGR